MKLNMGRRGVLLVALTIFAGKARAHHSINLSELLEAYRPVHTALVNDNFAKAHAAAKALEELATDWLKENPEDVQVANVKAINTGAGKVADSEDLDEARVSFVPVSLGTVALIRADEALKSKWQLFFCPMVAKKQGYWVQPKGEDLANPYMGQAMPGCGSKKPW